MKIEQSHEHHKRITDKNHTDELHKKTKKQKTTENCMRFSLFPWVKCTSNIHTLELQSIMHEVCLKQKYEENFTPLFSNINIE